MPEILFHVTWPDGSAQACYSPSLVVMDHFVEGTTYPLDDFVDKSRAALTEAQDRVRAIRGFACTSAAEQLADIERRAAGFAEVADATVRLESFAPPAGAPPEGSHPG